MADGGELSTEEALRYWGPMFHPNRRPTERLEQLLTSIVACVVSKYEPPRDGSPDFTPRQLAWFYRKVGGDYDPLFIEMPSQSIAFIYKSLGCLHSLQPVPIDDGTYRSPSIPALKPQGFVTWQTIQILLNPQEHVPFIQEALRIFPVVDPVEQRLYPKTLPHELFPSSPAPQMVAWHEEVSERLRVEAEQQQRPEMMRISSPPPQNAHGGELRRRRSHSQSAEEVEERADAAKLSKEGRPTIVRKISKAMPESVKQGSRGVALTMKNIASPHLWNNPRGSRSPSRRRQSSSEKVPTHGTHLREEVPSPHHPRDREGPARTHSPSRRRPRPPPRDKSDSSASSFEQRQRQRPTIRRHSHDLNAGPRDPRSKARTSSEHRGRRSSERDQLRERDARQPEPNTNRRHNSLSPYARPRPRSNVERKHSGETRRPLSQYDSLHPPSHSQPPRVSLNRGPPPPQHNPYHAPRNTTYPNETPHHGRPTSSGSGTYTHTQRRRASDRRDSASASASASASSDMQRRRQRSRAASNGAESNVTAQSNSSADFDRDRGANVYEGALSPGSSSAFSAGLQPSPGFAGPAASTGSAASNASTSTGVGTGTPQPPGSPSTAAAQGAMSTALTQVQQPRASATSGRADSAAKNSRAVNGVGGRRYATEVPWT